MTMHRKLHLVLIALLAVILTLLTYNLFFKDNFTDANNSDNPAMRVFVKDLYELEGPAVDPGVWNTVEHILYDNVSSGDNDLYTGTVRDGSYSETLSYTPSGNIRIQRLIVDIEPTKVTYLVSIRKYQSFLSVDVTCAPKEQQLDTSAACKEPDWL